MQRNFRDGRSVDFLIGVLLDRYADSTTDSDGGFNSSCSTISANLLPGSADFFLTRDDYLCVRYVAKVNTFQGTFLRVLDFLSSRQIIVPESLLISIILSTKARAPTPGTETTGNHDSAHTVWHGHCICMRKRCFLLLLKSVRILNNTYRVQLFSTRVCAQQLKLFRLRA